MADPLDASWSLRAGRHGGRRRHPEARLAATVAARIGLPHHPVDAVWNAASKARQRQRWAAVDVARPQFDIVPAIAPEDPIRHKIGRAHV